MQEERNTVEVNLSGAIVFFTLGEDSNHTVIKDGFKSIGIGHAVPDTNTALSALKSALVKTFGNRQTKIDALVKPAQGYTVTRVKGDMENSLRTLDYSVAFTAEVPATTFLPFHNPSTGQQVEPSGADECRTRFIDGLNRVGSHKLSRALVNLIEGQLNGISLRPTGGIYWLPEESMRLWGQVAQVVESASGSNQVYRIRSSVDNDSIKAICAALTRQVESETEKMNEEILTGDFQQERAFNSRRARACVLREKVQEYERVLGTTLDALQAKCEETDKQAAAACLAAFL